MHNKREIGTVKVSCPECDAMNTVVVWFADSNKKFEPIEHVCHWCGSKMLVSDPHNYRNDGTIITGEYAELIAEILKTPSISAAIANGEYPEEEITAEFEDQLRTKDVELGLLMLEDLAPEVVAKIMEVVK